MEKQGQISNFDANPSHYPMQMYVNSTLAMLWKGPEFFMLSA